MALLPKKKLPLLNIVMKLGKISNETLAIASGVSIRTISEARRKNGKPIRTDFAGYIEQAAHKLSKEL